MRLASAAVVGAYGMVSPAVLEMGRMGLKVGTMGGAPFVGAASRAASAVHGRLTGAAGKQKLEKKFFYSKKF
jgi:hypothetical protein